MLYELVEWGLPMALAPQDADSYNGQQGDMWDAQKDMSAALLGVTVAIVVLFLTRRGRLGVPPNNRLDLPARFVTTVANDATVAPVPPAGWP